jgi:hypothetical protein
LSENSRWYFSALISLFLTLLMVNSSLSGVVDRKLIDGSVMELGRYHFTFEAYEYISEDEAPSVIAWGSSKMRESFDGSEMEKISGHKDANFYNLGYASELPYLRLPEVSSMISSNPDVLVLELGPNTFSYLSTPLDGSSLEKMNSLIYHSPLLNDGDYMTLMEHEDIDLLDASFGKRLKGHSRYSFPAIENYLIDEITDEETGWNCDQKLNNVRCAPHSTSVLFEDYLRKPPQFSNYLERIKPLDDGTLEEFYGERLDNYVKSRYHNPEGSYNKNHRAFDYIINEAIGNDIEVVLLALPYNPVLMQRLTPNQWGYLEQAIVNYSQRDDLTTVNLLDDSRFGNDSLFNDFSHMSELGEKQLSRVLIPYLDEVLSDKLGVQLEDTQYPEEFLIIPTTVSSQFAQSIDLLAPHLNESGANSLAQHTWEFWEKNGKSGMSVQPDSGASTKNTAEAPHLQYCLEIPTTDLYYVWIHSQSPNSNSDSIWLGVDGTIADFGDRGVGLYDTKGARQWFNIGDNGERLVFQLEKGQHCLDIWMREDGVVLNEVILTINTNWMAGG